MRVQLMKKRKELRHETNINQMPASLTQSCDDPQDETFTLNQLINNCFSKHAPTKQVKFTRQPAPWIKDHKII